MDRVAAMILAGGAGERLSVLVAERAKPAVPFGGRYRIIDFALSNCVNSGISTVAVLTQYNPRSLSQHLGVGRPWDLDRAKGGLVVFQPFLSRSGRDWYKGTADAVYQNLYFLENMKVDEVLILCGDHIYIMRYDRMIATHRNRKADVTVALTQVPMEETSRYGIIGLDHNERIVEFEEKPKAAKCRQASMGVYVFNKNILASCLEENARKKDGHDFGRDILPEIIGRYKTYGYRFNGYWRDVGTVESYWQANMDLIVDLPSLNLYNLETEIRTSEENLPPVKCGPNASMARCIVSNGAIINGRVENSVIFPRVFVEEDAVVKDSIIFNDTTVGKGAIIDRSIVDKQVWIGPGCHIGYGENYEPNKEEPAHLNTGITVVGKGSKLPNGLKIGRNCRIGCWVESNDFESLFVSSGESITRQNPRGHPM